MEKPEIYLYGASGHGRVIIEIIEKNGAKVAGIFDDNNDLTEMMKYPVIGSFDPEKFDGDASMLISIGDNAARKRIAAYLDVSFASVTHPAANISARAVIGQGTVMMAGVTVNSYVEIGEHCILNTNCSVDHDCVIADYVHISPNAALAGNVKAGEGSHIGIGSCVLQGVSIGKWVTVGAGAVVIRDVPDYAVVVGNPARIIKYNPVTQ
ncbi:MAG TPA: acetyltransferase [Chitinophaga sp.]|uniref:acetyltransferase n=1 Tax=Chitinophaga sp. TaxID=1869181 RepID=UPI002BAD105E|nr:acetyltransferase [Chitinophaga sp.]HVI48425.1 acetyltransferase [Chitinophaga sp.]